MFRCLFDYVDIFTIDITNMKHLLQRLCDKKLPQPIISVHQRIELVFKSTFADQGHVGFIGTYEFIDESTYSTLSMLRTLNCVSYEVGQHKVAALLRQILNIPVNNSIALIWCLK